jgi:hypothetical protein
MSDPDCEICQDPPVRGSGYAGRWDAADAAVEAARKSEVVNSNVNLNPSREGCSGKQKQKEKQECLP